MTGYNRYIVPFETALDEAGVSLPGALLYFYETQTATPLDTYSDSALAIPNENPVVADASGLFPDIFLLAQDYKVVLKDADFNEIWTADPVSPFIQPTVTSYYDIPIYIEGVMSDSEIIPIFNVVRNIRLPANLTGSIATIGVNPTGSLILTLVKNGSAIGTITFSTGGAPTVFVLSNIDFDIGDQFSMAGPATHDVTGSQIAITFVFTVR